MPKRRQMRLKMVCSGSRGGVGEGAGVRKRGEEEVLSVRRHTEF